ncbi:hypothetical protein [Thalassotalea sp. ND16A]|uniref:hypothetical protein n=1 Tax=Thalassotalea sp. ND16A TaxID=1535422 RepID=UPI00051A7767|nr:hypothetical protein [Thalassotalea sp. ND16A]KGJ96036.1 hypothetical protein ND16A_1095 [Thalassotalea sp. ND16A]
MMKTSISTTATIVKGHQVASGNASSTVFSAGTISLQAPYFNQRGLDLSSYYFATLNCNLGPHCLTIIKPSYCFKNLKWHAKVPAETFSFADCEVIRQGVHYHGLIYQPHVETKIDHFQDKNVIEVIAPFIENIHYQDEVVLSFDTEQVVLRTEC